jgi:hypothetical protein
MAKLRPRLLRDGTAWILAMALSALPFAADAQQSGDLTLSCTGTYQGSSDSNSHPQGPMGIIVSGNTVSVAGYTSVPVVQLTPTEVDFNGKAHSTAFGVSMMSAVDGSIDRVTGQTNVTISTTFANNTSNTVLNLVCKPSRQMF